MAESPEHQFLSQRVTLALEQLSRTHLYAYVEAERRKFDFACELKRDWSRPLVGQTLWHHTAGVDKDLRTMLLDADAEVCVYVARDTVKARRLLSEVMRDYRSSGGLVAPHRLRVFWVPQDFDADDEAQRNFVGELLQQNVGHDILLNIVFGNLTAEDVRFFIRTTGSPGLHLALLSTISQSKEPILRMQDLATVLGVSAGAIRERLLRLVGCGFLTQSGGGATPSKATLKGRVFLDLCGELQQQTASGQISGEILQILRLLELRYAPSAVKMASQTLHIAGRLLVDVPEMLTGRLLATISAASERWGVDFQAIDHVLWNEEAPLETLPIARNVMVGLREESRLYSDQATSPRPG